MSATMEDGYRISSTHTDTRNWLQDLLKDWADWHHNCVENAYPSATPTYRAQWGGRDVPPASTPPQGVETPRNLQGLVTAMQQLQESSDDQQAIAVVRTYYLYGEQQALETHDLKRRKMFDLKARGESAIRGYMRASAH